jgi:2-keto-4-pentenoate hydratase/2-oxohepta-3-ene-1,7-dioic acid hydratase in catechol pathway
VGATGNESPVVMDATGDTFAVPSSMGDFTPDFWGDGVEVLAARLEKGELSPIDIGDLRLGAPIVRPGKIVCIGLNYRDHASETGLALPSEPVVFLKAPNCLAGPNDDVLRPRGATQMDWEIELAVVIAKRCRYLEGPSDAASKIAGFALSNDLSEREWQLNHGGQWDKGKCFETFNPLGPWVSTVDEITDAQRLDLHLDVNGVPRQRGNTADMVFDVNYLIWYLSQIMVLEAGDLINTGTPAGVSLGHENVPYLEAGDVIELLADGLGAQRNRVVQA